MIDLIKYFPAAELDLAWNLCDQITFIMDEKTGSNILARGMASRIADCGLPEMDRRILLSATKTIGEFLRQGPVIIRPGLAMCHALVDTEINFHVTKYHQPFPIVGVEIPTEILGEHGPALAFVYQLAPFEIICWYRTAKERCTYHCQIGPDLATIEERLNHMEWADTEGEAQLFHKVCRIAINACVLSAVRQVSVSPLPNNVVNRRQRRGDERVRQLAARQCQEIVFRDLVIYDRKPSATLNGTPGVPQGRQHRRGHWRDVAFGEKFSQHRLRWISDYWTHKEILDENIPGIILK